MDINYKNSNLQKICTDYRMAVKQYNTAVADKLHAAINFMEAADNISAVVIYPPFHFHPLQRDRKGFFAIDLGRKLGFRLIVRPKKENRYATVEEIYGVEACEIVIIRIEEVTNHYE